MNNITIISKWLNERSYSTTPTGGGNGLVIHYGSFINIAQIGILPYSGSYRYDKFYLHSAADKLLDLNLADVNIFAKIEEFLFQRVKERIECWHFPLKVCTGIPLNKEICFDLAHPGSYGYFRKKYRHTGIDLYTNEHEPVMAVEDGKVVSKGPFTGEQDGTPWWLDTDYVMIEGASGVILYGEIDISPNLNIGDKILASNVVGKVKRIIRSDKERWDISGWRPSMLHLELYKHGCYRPVETITNDLNDPTKLLLDSANLHKLYCPTLTL